MAYTDSATTPEPPRSDIDAAGGALVLEFGTAWCGYCRAAQPLIREAFAGHEGVRHVKVEDGSGRPLGRSFRVKLWPTLVFIKDGVETAKLVRPQDEAQIRHALQALEDQPPT